MITGLLVAVLSITVRSTPPDAPRPQQRIVQTDLYALKSRKLVVAEQPLNTDSFYTLPSHVRISYRG